MNGIKVYLKSGISKGYFLAQGVVGILLVMNALREYERAEFLKLELLTTLLAATALVLGWLVPKTKRRKLRYLPGLLLVAGGLSLVWLTQASSVLLYYRYSYLILICGYTICTIGALQPFVDVSHVAYFTTDGIRYRSNLFLESRYTWANVKGIVHQENGFTVELKSGKAIRMVPYDTNSQNLRAYIDKLQLKMKHGSEADVPATENVGSAIQSSPRPAH